MGLHDSHTRQHLREHLCAASEGLKVERKQRLRYENVRENWCITGIIEIFTEDENL